MGFARIRVAGSLAALVTGLYGFSTVSGAPVASPAVKAEQIEATLQSFSKALASGDEKALRELTTPAFTLLDEGRVYNIDTLVASVREILATGEMTRQAEGIEIQLRGNVAWCHYRVTGRFAGPKGKLELAFLEAVVLEQINNEWRISLVTTQPQATASQANPG